MKRVGLVLKRGKVEAEAIAREIIPWLLAQGCEAFITEEHANLAPGAREVPETELAAQADMLVVLGGDGTLLHAASLLNSRVVPLLGINLGRLGFLTPFDPHEAKEALSRALRGELPVEERMRLRVILMREGAEPIERLALNDAVVAQGAMARLIELLALLDGHRITLYKADGLIVATPTGSTAYSLAAGGPILTPGQAAMAITPICPHTLTNRPLVVPATAGITVQLEGETRSAILTVDGQWAHALAPGDRVRIEQASLPLPLYRSGKNYFEILRDKLKWGEREASRTC
ncbi:MAG: NAD(+)/NADH kinase [Deltaproteobacteria bacterium]|nr:NAD(+)/NADH kinase [Deltaproteobacteria bacterium]